VMQKIVTEYIPIALQEGSWFGESVILNREGGQTPISQVGLVLRDEHGAPEFLATIIRDITEQKRVESELKRAKEAAEMALAEQRRLVEIIEATSDLVGTADLEGNVL